MSRHRQVQTQSLKGFDHGSRNASRAEAAREQGGF
jgi:hypothetical protein